MPPFHIFLTDNIKVQYLQFMSHMKTPQYRSNLQQLLEQEKVIIDYKQYFWFATMTVFFKLPHHDLLNLLQYRASIFFAFLLPNLSPACSCLSFRLQQKHRDLSGQAEQLHSVCQSHKDKIKGLFQTKLDEVGTAVLLLSRSHNITTNLLILTPRDRQLLFFVWILSV